MYGMFGGCTTLFHLAVRHPVIVLALTLGGLAYEVQQSPGPGDRMGTEAVLMQVQKGIIATHPSLPTKVDTLKVIFDTLSPVPTEDQVNQVLKYTDACTDVSAKDILSNPTSRREAAWLIYLDVYSREGPGAASKLFVHHYSPPRR